MLIEAVITLNRVMTDLASFADHLDLSKALVILRSGESMTDKYGYGSPSFIVYALSTSEQSSLTIKMNRCW